MPTSGPGSSLRLHGQRQRLPCGPVPRPARSRGFTLLELLVVLAIVAISAGLATLALRDGDATRLERDAVRIAALLEMARAESRVSGTPVRWVPGAQQQPAAAASATEKPVNFRFVGLSGQTQLPSHWLHEGVTASVAPPGFLTLGPEAILPAQRLTLRLQDQQIDIVSDGLGPFTVAGSAPAAPP